MKQCIKEMMHSSFLCTDWSAFLWMWCVTEIKR